MAGSEASASSLKRNSRMNSVMRKLPRCSATAARASRPSVIVIDGLRPVEVGVLEIGELPQEIAPVLVERDHQLVVGLGEAVEQEPARDSSGRSRCPTRQTAARWPSPRGGRCSPGSPTRRRHRRCRSRRSTRRTTAAPRSNRRSRGSPRARPASGSCRACRSWRLCRARRRRPRHSRAARTDRATCRRWGSPPSSPARSALQLEAAVVGRQDQDRRQPGPRRSPTGAGLRQIDVERQTASVPHRDVKRSRLADGKRCWSRLCIVGRRHTPAFTRLHRLGHGGHTPYRWTRMIVVPQSMSHVTPFPDRAASMSSRVLPAGLRAGAGYGCVGCGNQQEHADESDL